MAKVLWREIAEALRQDIESGRYKVGETMPTEEAVTREWDVSRMTVHRAMQELQRCGLVARRRGSGTIVTDPLARAVGQVALVFPNWLNLLEIELMRGISAGFGEGQQILFCDTRGAADVEARQLRRMRKQAAGILCIPTCDRANTPLMQGLAASGYPLVCVDRVPQGVAADAVVTDNYGASVEALRHLAARGHRRIAHFTHGVLEVSSVRERYQAFLDVTRELGEAQPERLVRRFPHGDEDFEQITQLAQDALFALLHGKNPPTAVFCMNDFVLGALLEACERLGVRVPDDLEIASFNDALLLPTLASRLHLVQQQPHLIGQMAAERLLRRMRGEALPPEVQRVPAEFHPARHSPAVA